jgi:DNA polymerase (family 10)
MIEIAAIIEQLRTTATLLALHEANPFQVQYYQQAAQLLEQLNTEGGPAISQLAALGQPYRALVEEVLQTGTLKRYQTLISQTPAGVLSMVAIPGLGPKRVRALWKGLDIESIDQLMAACQQGRVAAMAGFGPKTQATILENIVRMEQYQQKWHHPIAWQYATALGEALTQAFPGLNKSLVGALRRMMPVVEDVTWLVATSHPLPVMEWLNSYSSIQQITINSGPFAWRGKFIVPQLPLQVLFCSPEGFYQQCIMQTGSADHLAFMTPKGLPLGQVVYQAKGLASEAAGYQAAELPYITPELREGLVEARWIAAGAPALVTQADIKGILHVHTTYSDGQDTLLEMAAYCKAAGYTYVGITDHSQSAAYAGGLKVAAIEEQHQAIDELNATMAPFKIFKGIEVDILPDGSLDYPAEILSKFDFTIASIHMAFSMTQEKATARLIKAIQNPFTTMIGHSSGRLLLKREGYPLDYPALIAACASYGVILELNANYWRLDLDWRWIPMALEQGVKISINPDAHRKTDIDQLSLALAIARKGALTPCNTLNAWHAEEVASYFQQRKQLALKT